MKKLSSLIVAILIFATAFLTLSGFNSPQESKVSKTAKVAQGGEQIDITFNRRPNVFTLTTDNGTITGTWRMVVTFTGQAFHCVNTLTSTSGTGTLVALSNCNNQTMKGNWRIISGTGDFVDMEGNGSLEMFVLADGRPSHEIWEGTLK